MSELTEKKQHPDHFYKPGQSGNPAGRPKGSISLLTRLKKEFRENPDKLEEFMERYINNPQNEKHIMEMIDGKPQAKIDHTTGGKELPVSINIVQPNGDNVQAK